MRCYHPRGVAFLASWITPFPVQILLPQVKSHFPRPESKCFLQESEVIRVTFFPRYILQKAKQGRLSKDTGQEQRTRPSQQLEGSLAQLYTTTAQHLRCQEQQCHPTGMLGLPPTLARALARSLQALPGGPRPTTNWLLLCVTAYGRCMHVCVRVSMCVALHPSIFYMAHLLH